MAEYIIQSAYGSEIPPWSALEITAGTAESGRTVYTVTRPTADNLPAGRVLFSGACAIAAGGYGMGYSAFDKAVFCAGTADGTTGYCGVAANSFELSGTNTGFVCPTKSGGRIPVRPVGGGAGAGVAAAPLDLTYADEHAEAAGTNFYAGYDGDNVLWDRRKKPEGGTFDGAKITMPTGISYYDDGDQKIYAYHVVLTFDSAGMLVKISQETRVVIETPEVWYHDG